MPSPRVKKLSLADKVRMDIVDFENTLCKSTRLIENNSIYLRQHFHISGALNKYTVLGRTAYSAEERKRNGNNKGAGTRYYQEYACSCKPCLPYLYITYSEEERRNNTQYERCYIYCRSLVSCKFSYEVFDLCFLVGCVFDKL